MRATRDQVLSRNLRLVFAIAGDADAIGHDRGRSHGLNESSDEQLVLPVR